MKLCAVGLHRWSDWKLVKREVATPVRVRADMSYKGPAVITYREDWQRRTCKKCGRIEMEALP